MFGLFVSERECLFVLRCAMGFVFSVKTPDSCFDQILKRTFPFQIYSSGKEECMNNVGLGGIKDKESSWFEEIQRFFFGGQGRGCLKSRTGSQCELEVTQDHLGRWGVLTIASLSHSLRKFKKFLSSSSLPSRWAPSMD